MTESAFQDKVFANVCQGVDHLYSDQQLCDLKVIVGDKTFQCHRLVLAAVSRFFQSCLTLSWRENSCKEVSIEHEDVPAESFSLLLDILYKGKDVITMGTAKDVLRMSIFLQINFLEEHCQQYLTDNMEPENCMGIWLFADTYQLPRLAKTASNMAVTKLTNVPQSEELLHLSKSILLVFLASQTQLMMDAVCQTVLRWVEGDMETRKDHLVELLPFISFPHLTQKYISTLTTYFMHPFMKIIVDGISEAITYNLDIENATVRRQILARQDAMVSSPNMTKCVVLVGGRAELEKPLDGVVCFPTDPPPQQYRVYNLKPLPESCGLNFATCKWRNEIYISGGSQNFKIFAKYKPGDEEWEVLPSMLYGRHRHAMAAVGGSIYVVGGLEKGISSKKSESVVAATMVYYSKTKEWSIQDHVGLPVQDATAAVLGHRLYVFGGQDVRGQATDVVQCVDTVTGCVYQAGRLPSPTYGARALSDGGTIYVATAEGQVLRMKENFIMADLRERQLAQMKAHATEAGEVETKRSGDESSSPTVSFTTVGDFPKRQNFGAFLHGEELVICGGQDDTGTLLDELIGMHLEKEEVTKRNRRLLTGAENFGLHVLLMPNEFLLEGTSTMQPIKPGDQVKPNPNTCSSLPTVQRQLQIQQYDENQYGMGPQYYNENAISYDAVGNITAVQPDGNVIVDFENYKGWTCPATYLMLV